MASGENIELAKCFITIVPSMEGSQKTIAEELGASAQPAAKEVGEQSGVDFGNALANGIKATAAVVAAATAAIAGAAVAAGKAFIDSANDVAEWGNTIDKESQKLQWSAQAYQEWNFILEHTGASIDGMKTAMKKLTIAAEENNDAFAQLGISQEQLAEMNPEELWSATVSALQNVSDEGERLALANELMGKSSVELLPLLNMTEEETEDLKTSFDELGGAMSDEAVKAAAEYEDELQNMNVALDGVKNNMMSKFLPGMSQVMKGLSLVFSGNGGIEEIKEGLDSIVSNLVELSPQFLEIASAIVMSILDGFAPMIGPATEAIFSFLNEALLTLVNLIPSLLPVITTALTTLMSTVLSCLPLITSSLLTLVTDLVTWLASGDNVKTFTNSIVSLVSQIASQMSAVLPVLLPAIVSIIGDVATTITTPENISTILEAVLLVIGAILVALGNSVPEFVEYYTGLLTNIKGNIENFAAWVSPYISQAWNTILGIFKSWGSNIKTYITGLISGIWSTISSWITTLQNGFTNGFNNIQTSISNILNSVGSFVQNCINTLTSLPGEILSIGSDMAEGLINGLDVDWVVDQVKKLGKKAIKALKETLGIASPSKEFEEIGYFSALGFGGGWSDEMDRVESDMVDSMSDLTGTMSAEVTANGVTGAATVGDTTTINGGNITMNIYGAEGQDVNSLADVIAEKLGDMTARKGAVYA